LRFCNTKLRIFRQLLLSRVATSSASLPVTPKSACDPTPPLFGKNSYNSMLVNTKWCGCV
jgi:hypothetical protein